jgi:hypothetical protein
MPRGKIASENGVGAEHCNGFGGRETYFPHLANMRLLGKCRAHILAMGLSSGYPQPITVMWAGPPMGTCGGGQARSPYETITSIELDTLLGATRPDSFA